MSHFSKSELWPKRTILWSSSHPESCKSQFSPSIVLYLAGISSSSAKELGRVGCVLFLSRWIAFFNDFSFGMETSVSLSTCDNACCVKWTGFTFTSSAAFRLTAATAMDAFAAPKSGSWLCSPARMKFFFRLTHSYAPFACAVYAVPLRTAVWTPV